MAVHLRKIIIFIFFAVFTLGYGDSLSSPDIIHISPKEEDGESLYKKNNCPVSLKGYTVNFNDIGIVEYIQFLSKISGLNFIFDKQDLQFKMTIVSEDPTSVEDLMAALVQILRAHGLTLSEQGNNVLINRGDQNASKLATIITDDNVNHACDAAIITRVFKLINISVNNIAGIVKPLLSKEAVVEVSVDTGHLIVTDLVANINKIADLLTALDMPDITLDIKTYDVKGAYPSALVAYAKEILGPLAKNNSIQLVSQPSSNRIFIVATPYLMEKTMQVLSSLDDANITETIDLPASEMGNNHFYMYKLKYQDGRAISKAIRAVGDNLQSQGNANMDFVSAIASVQWLEVNNSIVVSGTQDAIDKVVTLFDDLDKEPKQVFIEVLIIDTELQNSLDFGVQWIALGEEQDKLAYASGLIANSPPAANIQGGARVVAANPNPPRVPNPSASVPLASPANLVGFGNLSNAVESFGFGIVGNIIRHNGQSFLTLGALISALEEEANTVVVLNPRIMTEDTQQASIFVGQNIPYQTTSSVIQQTGSVTQNIQYEDVGVQLRVTPTISPDNIVTLVLDQSIAELVSAIGTLTPTTNKTLTTTRVHVPNGCFLVMSGHIREQQTAIHSGIPCLGSLPLIGPTFSRTIEQREKRNLIMFLRPHVITNTQEGLDLTNQEGYNYNWGSNPCSIIECGIPKAPECETYPPPRCPPN